MTNIWMEKYRPKSEKDMTGSNKLRRVINNFLDEAVEEIERIKQINKKIRSGISVEPAKKAEKKAQNVSISKWLGGSSEKPKPKTSKRTKTIKKKKNKDLETPDTKKTTILLRGPPGIGKTTIVYAIANDRNIQVTETNASDARTVDNMKELISPATQCKDISSYFGKKNKDQMKIILIDEVDGISGTSERGSVTELVKIIKKSMYPIVLISNEWKSKLKPIYNICKEYEVERPTVREIHSLLKKISRLESLDVEDGDLLRIAKNANGDYRAGVNDLQTMNLSERDQLDNVFESIEHFFGASSKEEAEKVFRSSPIDQRNMFRWVFENMDSRTTKKNGGIACDLMSRCDLILEQILSVQEWSMFPQFLDVFKTTTNFFDSQKGRINTPKWFPKNSKTLEELMNEHNISSEEARIMSALMKDLLS